MYAVQGTPVNINGRTGTSPGPAAITPKRVAIPVPAGRGFGGTGTGGAQQPATTFARYLHVFNVDPTNDLRVSFMDDTYVTLKPGTDKEFSGTIPFFSVASSLSTVLWEAIAIVAA